MEDKKHAQDATEDNSHQKDKSQNRRVNFSENTEKQYVF